MIRKPVKIGNELAIVFDEKLLKELGITEDTVVSVSIDGRQIIIQAPENEGQKREWENQRAKEIIHEVLEEYAEAFEKMAKN